MAEPRSVAPASSGGDLVTVVIPACNEEAFLGACLDSVRAQDYPQLQIVVIDGASDDGTVAVVEKTMATDDRIELVRNQRRNISSSLNLALERALGVWLVRVDAHSTIPPSYVRLAVQRLRAGTWAGVGGRKDGVGRTAAGRAIAVAMGSRFGVGNSTYHFGTKPQEVDHLPFGAYPVDVLCRVGGWDESLVANEDFELDYRLRQQGGRLLFDPGLVIDWHCRQSIGDLFRQYHRYGRGKVDVVRLHPESLQLRHVVAPAFVAYLAVGGVLAGRRPRRWLAVTGPYLLAVAVESLRSGRKLTGSDERVRLPAAFMAMHVGWGLGFWAGVRTTLRRLLPAGGGRTS